MCTHVRTGVRLATRLHIIQTSEEFISEVNGNKEISSKVMIMMQTKLTDQ